jgi:hypothetical protein
VRTAAASRPATPIVLSSSIQAELDNPYGVSKRQAEQVLADYAARSGALVAIFRLSNVFGKWCRPNYNSVVATFCHNIARDLPIVISDPSREVPLVHVDDVVQAFLEVGAEVRGQRSEGRSQESEVRGQKPEVRGQSPGAGNPRVRTHFSPLTIDNSLSDPCLLRSSAGLYGHAGPPGRAGRVISRQPAVAVGAGFRRSIHPQALRNLPVVPEA